MSSENHLPWQTVEHTVLAENPYWSYRRDRYLGPHGEPGDYYYVHSPGSVLAIALLDATTLLMVRQFRYLGGREGLEFAGGGRKPEWPALACAQAELREETGYRADCWQELGGFNPCKGLTDEWCTVFLCRELHFDPIDGADPFEVTTAAAVAIAAMPERIARGEIWCGMTLAAWALALPTVLGPTP